MGERRLVYRILVGKAEGKDPLGRRRRRWEEIIKMNIQHMRYGGMDWIDVWLRMETFVGPLST
jgi:hypothetical protein